MANQISFVNLWDLLPQILTEASQENSSELLNCRLVCKNWHAHCETLLNTLWKKLKETPPPGPVNLGNKITEVDDTAADLARLTTDAASPVLKFKKLAVFFKNATRQTVPITIADFQSLQNETATKTLALWPRLHPLLLQRNRIPNLPPLHADFRVIYAFLNDSKRQSELFLSAIDLSTVPSELDQFRGVTKLLLRDNKLSEIPNLHMPGLTVCDLGHNQLSQFPNFIIKLQCLVKLSLEKNQLSEVPNLDLRVLTRLELAQNQLSKVSNLNLPKLAELCLQDNRLSELSNLDLPNLTDLDARNNQVSKLAKLNLPNLTDFDLANNQLNEFPNFILPKLKCLYLHGNMIIVMPDEFIQRFSSNGFIGLFKSQLTYNCQSPLAFLYQKIIANKSSQKEIHDAFDSLDQQHKDLIFKMVWKVAGMPVTNDTQWGERHAFDEMPRFGLAVQKVILAKLELLSNEKKSQVYGEVNQLAGRPPTQDSQWGEEHAKEHLPRLADALSRVH